MMTKQYPEDQMKDAVRLADALRAVGDDRRELFLLMLDSMATGAKLAESRLGKDTDPAA